MQAGGTHPTGMLSCYILLSARKPRCSFSCSLLFFPVGVARGIVGATWAAAAMAFLKDNHGDPSWRNITPGTGVWVAGGRLGGGNEMPHLPPESSKIKPTDY